MKVAKAGDFRPAFYNTSTITISSNISGFFVGYATGSVSYLSQGMDDYHIRGITAPMWYTPLLHRDIHSTYRLTKVRALTVGGGSRGTRGGGGGGQV